MIILDEAHNLLRGAEKSDGEGVYSFAENFQNLLLEMRSIGVGFIIADQTADNVPTTIPDICGTKVFLGPSRFSGIERYAALFRQMKRHWNICIFWDREKVFILHMDCQSERIFLCPIL